MKKSKKFLALMTAAALSLSVLAGCGGGDKPAGGTTPEGGQPASGEGFNLSLCISSEPQTIDPGLSTSVDGSMLTLHMFEGLMKWGDSEANLAGNLNGAKLTTGQAESYDKVANDDGTVTYTFHLRDDIKWSDGKPVTAGDFEYAWKRLVNPATAADYENMVAMLVGYQDIHEGKADADTLGVKAVDDKTLEVQLSYDCPYFLEVCAFPSLLPVRQDTIEANGDQWTFEGSTYISNGAYRMVEWIHNAQIVMEKNPEYYDYDKLGPDTITFRLMDDQNAMLNAYNTDELQFVNDMPVDEIPTLLANGKMEILPFIGTYYVSYQTQKAPFDDPRVRKAFTLAIDSKYIVEKVTQTGQVPATGYVPTGVNDADPNGDDFRTVGGDYWNAPLDEATYKANLEEANRLLDEAGYEDRSTFPVVTYLYNTSDNHKAIGEALMSQWKNGLGVEVKLENQDWSVFLQTRKDGDYQIARNGWITDYNDPMAFLDMLMSTSGNNDAQYNNPDYDAALKRAMTTSDPVERMKAMHEAEDILLAQDWAVAPIYFYTEKCMLKDNVDGVYYSPLGFFFFKYATQG